MHSPVPELFQNCPSQGMPDLPSVRTLKDTHPDLLVLCDAKIMDAGAYEVRLAFDAGADIVTVLAVTDDLTIQDCM